MSNHPTQTQKNIDSKNVGGHLGAAERISLQNGSQELMRLHFSRNYHGKNLSGYQVAYAVPSELRSDARILLAVHFNGEIRTENFSSVTSFLQKYNHRGTEFYELAHAIDESEYAREKIAAVKQLACERRELTKAKKKTEADQRANEQARQYASLITATA